MVALHKRDPLQESLHDHALGCGDLGHPNPVLLEQPCTSGQQGPHVVASPADYEQCQCRALQPSSPLYLPTSPTRCLDLTGKVSVFPSQELEQKARASLHGDSLS